MINSPRHECDYFGAPRYRVGLRACHFRDTLNSMSKEQIGLLVSAAFGAVLGEVIGYTLFAISVGLPFGFWLHRLGSHTWAIHGAVLGAGACLLIRYVNAVSKR